LKLKIKFVKQYLFMNGQKQSNHRWMTRPGA
jgi:hypothetical protein